MKDAAVIFRRVKCARRVEDDWMTLEPRLDYHQNSLQCLLQCVQQQQHHQLLFSFADRQRRTTTTVSIVWCRGDTVQTHTKQRE